MDEILGCYVMGFTYLASPFEHKNPDVMEARCESVRLITSSLVAKGDVVFSIYDNVGLDFIKDRRNNWYECGFYLSDKTNINWIERYSKRTGNQIGEVYSGSNLYNSHRELIGKSKAKIYVSRDQLSNKIVLYAYTARQNLR